MSVSRNRLTTSWARNEVSRCLMTEVDQTRSADWMLAVQDPACVQQWFLWICPGDFALKTPTKKRRQCKLEQIYGIDEQIAERKIREFMSHSSVHDHWKALCCSTTFPNNISLVLNLLKIRTGKDRLTSGLSESDFWILFWNKISILLPFPHVCELFWQKPTFVPQNYSSNRLPNIVMWILVFDAQLSHRDSRFVQIFLTIAWMSWQISTTIKRNFVAKVTG